jgi:hypothetical protein
MHFPYFIVILLCTALHVEIISALLISNFLTQDSLLSFAIKYPMVRAISLDLICMLSKKPEAADISVIYSMITLKGNLSLVMD